MNCLPLTAHCLPFTEVVAGDKRGVLSGMEFS